MNKLFIPFIFSIVLTLINTKVIPTKDLQTALTQARPGDIIEIEYATGAEKYEVLVVPEGNVSVQEASTLYRAVE